MKKISLLFGMAFVSTLVILVPIDRAEANQSSDDSGIKEAVEERSAPTGENIMSPVMATYKECADKCEEAFQECTRNAHGHEALEKCQSDWRACIRPCR